MPGVSQTPTHSVELLNYRRHFTLLLFAGGLLWSVSNTRFSHLLEPYRLETYFASVGLLHAATIAFSVRATLLRKVTLIAAATILSSCAIFFAVGVSFISPLKEGAGLLSDLAATSALSAAVYWLLIRLTVMPKLALLSLAFSTGSCACATVLAWLAIISLSTAGSPDHLFGTLLAVPWWIAFSTSLLLGDHRRIVKPLLKPESEGRR